MDTIVETNRGSIKVIRFNRPRKKNALDTEMYLRVTKIINEAANDEKVSMIVVTGTGDFYSSGNDLSNLKSDDSWVRVLADYIQAFMTFPKLIIAVVNGPAIGIAATILPLFDLVFASDNAYFLTPFSKLQITAEGGSTLTFPKLIGQRKAAEMLLFNYKLSAKEALECGFINRVFKKDELEQRAWEKIEEVATLPAHSVLGTKNLLRRVYYEDLLKTNEVELEVLRVIANKMKSKM